MSGYDPLPSRDPGNPYAPPEVDLTPARPVTERKGGWGGVEPFSIDAALRRAWAVYKQRMGLCIGAVAANYGAVMGYQFASIFGLAALQSGGQGRTVVLTSQVVLLLGQYALQFILSCGQYLVLLKLARGEEAEFGDLFRGGPYVFRFVLASLLYGLLLALVGLACAIPAVPSAMALSGENRVFAVVVLVACVLAFFVGAFLLVARLGQYIFVLIDRDCGAVESLQRSMDLTRGHVLELFVLTMLGGLIAGSGILGCFVGLLFTIPLGFLILASGYVLLSGRGYPLYGSKARAGVEFLDDSL